MWNKNGLYNKATIYFRRGNSVLAEDKSHGLLLIIMGYELLMRASLAKIHPSLLCDPTNEAGLLFANGYSTDKIPKSAGMGSIVARALQVVKDFNKHDADKSLLWIGYRNEEVHSAGDSLDGIEIGKFQTEMYIIVEKILNHLGKDFDDLLGGEDGESAKIISNAGKEDRKKEVNDNIEKFKKEFNALEAVARLTKITESDGLERRDVKSWSVRDKCPACEGVCKLTHEIIKTGAIRVGDEELIQDMVGVPAELRCYSCGMHLKGIDRMIAIGKRSPKTFHLSIDPAEYYNIELTPDYGQEYMDE